MDANKKKRRLSNETLPPAKHQKSEAIFTKHFNINSAPKTPPPKSPPSTPSFMNPPPKQDNNSKKRKSFPDSNPRKKAKTSPAPAKGGSKAKILDPSVEFLDDPYSAPIIPEARKFFAQRSLPSFQIHCGEKHGWRTHAKVAVRSGGKLGPGAPQIGLFARGCHDVVSVSDCPVHHPAINEALKEIEWACKDARINGYDEKTGKGELRYLVFSVASETKKVQLTLVWNADSFFEARTNLDRLVKSLKKRKPKLWHAIFAHFRVCELHENAIFGRDASKWHLCDGEELCPTKFKVAMKNQPTLFLPPTVFQQANQVGFAQIIQEILKWVPKESKVVELYGGVGTIGLHCVNLVKSLVCSDENPFNVEAFDLAVAHLPAEFQSKFEYRGKNAADMAEMGTLNGCDLCIVDPPRKGLDEEVMVALMKSEKEGYNGPKRLIYVSCGFKALQGNIDRLTDLKNGKTLWKIVHASGYILFPGSSHLETLVVFDRIDETQKPKLKSAW